MHPPPAAGLVQDAITAFSKSTPTTTTTTTTSVSLATAAAATVATAVASLASSSPSSSSSSSNIMSSTSTTAQSQESQQGECRLLGSFALLVQAALGALALLSLVYKRWRERPQRPVKIWFFDVSKQVFGSVLVHVANIFMSMLTSGRFNIIRPEPAVAATQRLMMRSVAQDSESYAPNPCSFYLLNLAIDTTVGIPILIILLRILTGLATMTPLGKPAESILSGNYGSPPNPWWWLKQSIIYFGGLFGMKLCVLIIFIIFPWISKVGDWALGWTEGNERLQIAFVMMIFPLVMNALQYYIIDSFIKKKESDQHDRLSTDDPDEPSRPYDESTRLRAHRSSSESGDDDDDDDDDRVRRDQHARARSSRDYDPEVDGHAPTVVGSGSSRIKVAPTELFPKE
ncbi:hypothetical protein CP532_2655 [Ophiocordyceps camponoti-leonardi (nom. inval.)]|nr:hypothetical protein CP532_2655 [Ophiocordyceps camponoti-leonardi (nom. inval.)]